MHRVLSQPDTLAFAQAAVLQAWGAIWPYLLMILGFSLIVFVHELGHFVIAKWVGVKVEKFAIGFGREIFGITKGETRYSFNVLPVGGYVKMLGQEDFDDKSLELKFKDDPRSFVNKPVGPRMAIVCAGVVMNILFACLLFMVVFMIGMEAMGTGIAYVEPDSPADRAGVVPGDDIKEINGKTIYEFREVYTAVMLAPPHEPIEFLVQRDGDLKHISVMPEYLSPENTREARRQIVGIAPGITREIVAVGADVDQSRPDQPHEGDVIVEVGGIPVTDQNASQMIDALAYSSGDVYVERPDLDDPNAPARRARVEIPPVLTLYPNVADRDGSAGILGLAPPVRFAIVDPKGRAYLAGIEVGDTVLNWDDVPFPSGAVVTRAIQDSPERDIYFEVSKRDSKRVLRGFVRPALNRRGQATIHAVCRRIEIGQPAKGQPQARFSDVRKFGEAYRAGIEVGDAILSIGGLENPTVTQVNNTIAAQKGRPIPLTVRKTNGTTLSATVMPRAPGAIDASYGLVADDLLRVADIVPQLAGRPSPAAQAGVERGSLITAVDGQTVSRWRELIAQFRARAGTTVQLSYQDPAGAAHVTHFPVPNCLRTLLGVGPEGRIVSIDGRKTITVDSDRGTIEKVAVGYRGGTEAVLRDLIGRTGVPVEYRENPLAPIRTKAVDVTEDMVDPWLGRVAFAANIEVAPQMRLLRGANALDAVQIGIHKTYYFILTVYKTMERMIFSRSVGLENISGPLGIIDLGGRVARTGLVELIFFMAIISANLAVINFLPLPIVDGGLMVFLMIEKIKGSPVSLRVQVATQVIGLFLIIGTFLYVTFNDMMRLWG